MKRDIYQKLAHWKQSYNRKPLILNGARQVGKTYALQHFANDAYDTVVYLNFEKDIALASYFQGSLSPERLIMLLGVHTGLDITAEHTLLIFDEVQQCPRALTSLKYFCEEAPQYHVIAAGSLLGIKIAETSSFPVGKVNFLHLYPLSFFEFLDAIDEAQLRHFVEQQALFEPLPLPLHERLLELLRFYFFIGGMPDAVVAFSKTKNLNEVRVVQDEILKAYQNDFAKHAPENQLMKIITLWQQVHQQIAKENKKFVLADIKKNARMRDYEEAIQWLLDAGLVLKSTCVPTPKLPIAAYSKPNIFKLFMLDIGLLSAQSNLSAKTVIQGNQLFVEFKGALTENYIAQEFSCNGQDKLHYWVSKGQAEVDFLLEKEQSIYPLEIKAGQSSKKKSLLSYAEKYQPLQLSRATTMNFKRDGNICNYPLYLIAKFLISQE